MESGTILPVLSSLSITIARPLLLTVILPLLPARVFHIPVASAPALITGTFLIGNGAAAFGIGPGLPHLYLLFVLSCVAPGVTLTRSDIFDLVGNPAEHVSGFLKRAEAMAAGSVFLKNHGIYVLVPCVITPGVSVCPPVSWVPGWPRGSSIVLIMAGYVTISIVTILATSGFFSIFYP